MAWGRDLATKGRRSSWSHPKMSAAISLCGTAWRICWTTSKLIWSRHSSYQTHTHKHADWHEANSQKIQSLMVHVQARSQRVQSLMVHVQAVTENSISHGTCTGKVTENPISHGTCTGKVIENPISHVHVQANSQRIQSLTVVHVEAKSQKIQSLRVHMHNPCNDVKLTSHHPLTDKWSSLSQCPCATTFPWETTV